MTVSGVTGNGKINDASFLYEILLTDHQDLYF